MRGTLSFNVPPSASLVLPGDQRTVPPDSQVIFGLTIGFSFLAQIGPMRLAAKLVLLFLVGLLLIVGLFSYLTIQANQRMAIAEHQRYARDLAATLRSAMADRDVPPHELGRYFTQSTSVVQHVRVRWVELNGTGDASPSVPREMILARREVSTFTMPDDLGQPHFYTYLPVSDSQDPSEGHIEVAAPDTGASERLRQSLISSLMALLGVATLSGVVVWIGGINMVAKPLNQLIEKVHRVGQGDFDEPVRVRAGDELGKLAIALNEMCDQLAAQRDELQAETANRVAAVEQLRQSDRLNSVGRMAAGIAHEIGTPLNVVIGRAQLIDRDDRVSEQVKKDAHVIVAEAQRIAQIVRELLDFTRGRRPNRTRQPINGLLETTVQLMQPMARKQNAELILDQPAEPLVANFDASQIQQVMTNLILNAIQATDSAGRVRVSASLASDRLRIAVRDNGNGIATDDLPKVFEPFFTTKDVGEGTGLGLPISHGIVREHGGEIQVESTLGEGSCFTVILPVDVPDNAMEGNTDG